MIYCFHLTSCFLFLLSLTDDPTNATVTFNWYLLFCVKVTIESFEHGSVTDVVQIRGVPIMQYS